VDVAVHEPGGSLLGSVAVLGTIGFIWDYLAFKFGWWTYNATTGVKVARIPVEDVNFYLMAPTAAISLYIAFCRLFRSKVRRDQNAHVPDVPHI
jgi:lycopene cyclase domain-containing protein